MGKRSSKGHSVDGIPFPDGQAMAQTDEGVKVNRDEPPTAFNPLARDDEVFPNDYFAAETQRLRDELTVDTWTRDNREWSDGIVDEENDVGEQSFGELDRRSDDDSAPEAPPAD